MKKLTLSFSSAFLLNTIITVCIASQARADSWVRAEVGSAQTLFNYFQIPPDNGTNINLPSGGTQPYGRIEGLWQYGTSQGLRFVLAPFLASYSVKTSVANPVFNGVTFDGSEPLDVDFKFNSYRLSWVYLFAKSSGFSPRAGFTLKVRDAFIRVSDAVKSSEYANVGPVPLIYLGFDWELGRWNLAFDIDGLASRQGRAFDGRIEAQYSLGTYRLGLGTRVLDGGAENTKVFNFTRVGFTYLSLEKRF